MADPGDLYELADELLSFAADALDTIPILVPGLEGAPARQIVYWGLPVDDCDQIVVYVPTIGEADTTPGGLGAAVRPRVGRIDHVTINIRVIRCCLPMGTESSMGDISPPTPAQINATSQQILADGWALWNHIHNAKSSGVLRSLCDEMYFSGLIAVPPSGGCGGWVLPVRVQLDGYAEALGS